MERVQVDGAEATGSFNTLTRVFTFHQAPAAGTDNVEFTYLAPVLGPGPGPGDALLRDLQRGHGHPAVSLRRRHQHLHLHRRDPGRGPLGGLFPGHERNPVDGRTPPSPPWCATAPASSP